MQQKEQQGEQLVFNDRAMLEVARDSFLRQSLTKILRNAEKHEAEGNSYAVIRKINPKNNEDFVSGYLSTSACITTEPNEYGEEDQQVVAFVHSNDSNEILLIVRSLEDIDSETNSENQDIKTFVLPWPPMEVGKDGTKVTGMVDFLIDFAEKADAWDQFEAKMPSVQDFLRDSFLRQEDLDNL